MFKHRNKRRVMVAAYSFIPESMCGGSMDVGLDNYEWAILIMEKGKLDKTWKFEVVGGPTGFGLPPREFEVVGDPTGSGLPPRKVEVVEDPTRDGLPPRKVEFVAHPKRSGLPRGRLKYDSQRDVNIALESGLNWTVMIGKLAPNISFDNIDKLLYKTFTAPQSRLVGWSNSANWVEASMAALIKKGHAQKLPSRWMIDGIHRDFCCFLAHEQTSACGSSTAQRTIKIYDLSDQPNQMITDASTRKEFLARCQELEHSEELESLTKSLSDMAGDVGLLHD